MEEILLEQLASTSAYIPNLVSYQFQTTRAGDVVFSDRIWLQPAFPEGPREEAHPKVSLAVIDGELRIIDPGQPPGLRPASRNASLLHVREP